MAMSTLELRRAILVARNDIADGRWKQFDATLIRDIARRGKEKAKQSKG
jgi:hypothetical protein